MIDEAELESYLVYVFRRFTAETAHVELAQFMCRCLEQFEFLLPPIGKAAFEVAKSYWFSERGVVDELAAVRVACWRYLESKGRSVDVIDQEDAAMRALICVLYGILDSEEFSTDTVRWFAVMLDRLGDFSSVAGKFMSRLDS